MAEYKARPTIYKGIQMRSRLEAGYAAWLDLWGFDWEYEPQAFASEKGQYLPDFLLKDVVQLMSGRLRTTNVYVDVKSSGWQGDREVLAQRMALIWSSVDRHENELMLEIPGQPPMVVIPTGEHRWMSMTWVYDVHPATYGERLVLAMALDRDGMTWPHGFWNGPS